MKALFCTRMGKGKGKEEKGRKEKSESERGLEKGWVRSVRKRWKGKGIEIREGVMNGKEKGEIYWGK